MGSRKGNSEIHIPAIHTVELGGVGEVVELVLVVEVMEVNLVVEVVMTAEVVLVVLAVLVLVTAFLEVVDVTGGGAVPREGVAEQVLTCKPTVKEARPCCPSGSENPGGTVPTYALKL
jgi:hypothetical protein